VTGRPGEPRDDVESRSAPEASSFPHLANPPIHEAVIDFRLATPLTEARSGLEALSTALREEYPHREEGTGLEGSLTISAGRVGDWKPEREEFIGFRVKSGDGRRVAQLRPVGLTLSHHPPYRSWEAMFGEAWRLWEKYCDSVCPPEVGRLATRYINRLRLPAEFDTEDYFMTDISPPEGLPDTLALFNYFYVIKFDSRTHANVRLASEPAETAEHTIVVLDIDCYARDDFEPLSAETRDTFGQLRDLKNRIFFSTLKKRAVELYR
jgi:uncharacterized protein (TIGR04255 family)